ncbi:MAG: response regulator [Candidatus Kapaibacterium sp.]
MDQTRPIRILLVEDNRADAILVEEALSESKLFNRLDIVSDGLEALDYLRNKGGYIENQKPDLILLDLNMPKLSGIEVLKEIKNDEELKIIPVVIMTTSKSESDVIQSYNLHANCYITKPVDLEKFIQIVKNIEQFWFSIVTLPLHN